MPGNEMGPAALRRRALAILQERSAAGLLEELHDGGE
jgi:hypothetical protein